MRNKGFTLIELLVVILIIGILLALIIPNFVLFQERARRASVKNNMHVIQTALEAYAVDHMGNYPGEEIEFDDEESIIRCYFPGGDPFGEEGDPIFGELPINPYTGRRYNYDDMDLAMNLDDIDEPGMAAAKRTDDENHDCPYYELEPEEELQGSIMYLGYISDMNPLETPQEYGICGWGKDLTNPMYDRDPVEEDEFIYFVLHN
ncbi:MAG: prepilin-type N-terminal cleavage/methylation domain-containing protein [bacterium]